MPKSKLESFERKLEGVLIESGLIIESKRHQPAVIWMKRGTTIPVHHFRKMISPNTGETWIVAGIDPARYEVSANNGFGRHSRPSSHRMRDFFTAGTWSPCQDLIKRGIQDETGWSEPYKSQWTDQYLYDAKRDFSYIRKFRKVLTIKEVNIQDIKLLPPGTDPKIYEPEEYDDTLTWRRKQRIRGTRLS